MPFEFTPKQNFPDYTGYHCMVKNHLTLEVSLSYTHSVTDLKVSLLMLMLILMTYSNSYVLFVYFCVLNLILIIPAIYCHSDKQENGIVISSWNNCRGHVSSI